MIRMTVCFSPPGFRLASTALAKVAKSVFFVTVIPSPGEVPGGTGRIVIIRFWTDRTSSRP